MYLKHQLPCLHCQPHDYIRMVQHMIERCLLLQMSRDDCVKALAKHAKIEPIISLTVWKELLKENKAFFRDYFQIADQLKGGLISEEESIKKDDPKHSMTEDHLETK